MNICFIIDSWENIRPEVDSNLRIIHEAALRDHRVGILYPRNLTVRDNITYGIFQVLDQSEKAPERIVTFYKRAVFKKTRLPLKGFDIIFIRKTPPIDWLMLNFLDSVKDDTLIINTVDGLRMSNNKLYMTTFDDSHVYIPETHVSKNKEYLLDIISESNYDKMILKPLDGYGGNGVILLEKSAMNNIRSLLDFYIGTNEKKNYVIVQEFVQGAENGDVRVLMLGGEPIGAMRRKPSDNEFRSNVHQGGRPIKHVLSKREREICKLIGPKLTNDGLYFAGVDLIGGKLIEVNVCCPGGIYNINRLNKVKLEKKILDFLEEMYRRKETAFRKKLAFKKEVEGS